MEIQAMNKDEFMTYFFQNNDRNNDKVQMGVITLPPGVRQPQEGFSIHEQDEYSFVISGAAHTVLEDGQDLVGKTGDAQLISAQEKHYNYNDGPEDAVVVWFLVEK